MSSFICPSTRPRLDLHSFPTRRSSDLLEVDYPIMNTAQFQGPFEQSVEQLLKSAQLGAQPLRACFYSNQVLRIIPEPQSCLAGGHGVEDRETPADRKQGID